MECQNRMMYTIRQGDSLYAIAAAHGTDLPNLFAANPRIDMTRLNVGDVITVCPRREAVPYPDQMPAKPHISAQYLELSNKMRSLWEQHVEWTRMTIISAVEGLKDVAPTRARLLKNPGDMEAAFAPYYGAAAAKHIAGLFTQHLKIADQLVGALKEGSQAAAAEYNRQWYANADEIARYFARVSPYYNETDLRNMLHTHLDLIKKEAADRLAGKYQDDINDYDQIERQALLMADYFTNTIAKQFGV